MSSTEAKRRLTLYPLAILAAAFSIGILIQHLTGLAVNALLAVIGLSMIAAYVFRKGPPATFFVSVTFLFAGSLCYFIEANSFRADRIKSLFETGVLISGEPVELEGNLAQPPEPTFEGQIINLKIDKVTYRGQTITATGNVRLYANDSHAEEPIEHQPLELDIGARISVACALFREEQYQNPGVPSRLQIFDRQGIDATAHIKSPLLIEIVGDEPVFLPLAWIYDVRRTLIDRFRERFTSSTAGVLMASMLGDKYFLDKHTAEVFREGGTFHVLVISGLHITFIGGILLILVRTLTKSRSIQFIVIVSLLWAYTFAVGAEVPVVRASLMFTVLIFSLIIHRQGTLLNSLGACVLFLLAWRPSDLFNPSFQLTVVSVTAIVWVAFPLVQRLREIGGWMPSASTPFPPNVPASVRRFCEMLYWQPTAWSIECVRQIWTARVFKSPYLETLIAKGGRRLLTYLFEGLLVSTIVQICLLPLLIIYFHRVTPVSVLLNLWVGIVMALESFTALTAVALSGISEFLATPFFSLTEFLNFLIVNLPGLFTETRWSSWRVPHYSNTMELLYAVYFAPVLVLGALLWQWDPFAISVLRFRSEMLGEGMTGKKLAGLAAVVLAGMTAIVVFHPMSAPRADGRLSIDVLDVGQGDSALITFPDGTTMLIDGGGRIEFLKTGEEEEAAFVPDAPGIGEAVVSPVLWEKGRSEIDYIVATHPDADHTEGLIDVANNFAVREALFGPMSLDDPEFSKLSSVLAERGVRLTLASRGKVLRFGGATVEVLYPRADPSPTASSDNNNSVVVRIVYGNRAFLLTGDIEAEAENELVHGGGALRADIVKVPHHGSRTSSTEAFVNAVDADHAVISVGRRSRFGHPHKEVVDRWKAAGANVMTTSERGMITFSTDGRDLKVTSYR